MGYDLTANNPDAGEFHFGAFSWTVLLEACGFLWPLAYQGGQWYCVFGADPRMPEGDDYPRLLSNDGFQVTAEEARIMARVARNFATVQRSLPEENRGSGTPATQEVFRKEDVLALLARGTLVPPPGPWPVKIRDDFTDRLERFAAWAERSGGFRIY